MKMPPLPGTSWLPTMAPFSTTHLPPDLLPLARCGRSGADVPAFQRLAVEERHEPGVLRFVRQHRQRHARCKYHRQVRIFHFCLPVVVEILSALAVGSDHFRFVTFTTSDCSGVTKTSGLNRTTIRLPFRFNGHLRPGAACHVHFTLRRASGTSIASWIDRIFPHRQGHAVHLLVGRSLLRDRPHPSADVNAARKSSGSARGEARWPFGPWYSKPQAARKTP